MSERYRYTVSVTREGTVWADDADEAEAFALEDERNWPVVATEAVRDTCAGEPVVFDPETNGPRQ